MIIVKYKLTAYPNLVNAVDDQGRYTTFRINTGSAMDLAYQAWLAAENTPEEYQTPEELIQIAAVEYIGLRQQAYPSFGDQLDMIYWDRVNSTNNWETLITGVKTTYPKPT